MSRFVAVRQPAEAWASKASAAIVGATDSVVAGVASTSAMNSTAAAIAEDQSRASWPFATSAASTFAASSWRLVGPSPASVADSTHSSLQAGFGPWAFASASAA